MSELVAYRGESTRSPESKSLEDLKLELDAARQRWAAISAKRQNRLFDRRIRGYNQAQEEYNVLVAEYGRRKLADQIAAADTARERNIIALSYIVDMQNQLRAETDQISDGKRTRKFGRAIGKWLTTGSKLTQFAKGAAVSMAAGVVGGFAGATIATLAAVRFAKGYVTSEVSSLGQVDANTYHNEFAQDDNADTLLERAQARSAETFETAGDDQQIQKRAAVKRGMARMAVGFVVGGTVGSLIHGALDMPLAHATPIVDTTHEGAYSNPGLSAQGTEYSSPGLHEVNYGNPGLSVEQSSAMNPGLVGVEDTYTNPGLSSVSLDHLELKPEDSTSTYSNPGLTEVSGSGNDTYSNPGLIEVHSSTDTAASAPGLTEVNTDNYSNPGLIEVTPTETHGDNYSNPGLVNVTPETTHDVSDSSAEHIDLDGTFTVQHGNGYVREIMDAAKANDIKITSDQAWEIHKDIVNKVGVDYINLVNHHGHDTYSMGDSKYETGISAPGKAEWDAQAADIMRDKFAEIQAENTHDSAPVDHDAVDTDTHAEADATDQEFSEGAQHIGNAEGYYHELDQMGVPDEHQAEVLHEAAPQLYEQGAAYEMNDGLPGIKMTPDHMMTQESLDTLHQAAIDTNAGDDLTVTHEGIVFDEATDAASTTTTDDGEFLVSDFGQSYDVDAQNYYDALKDVDRAHWQDLLNEAAPQLQSITYNGESLTYHDASGWHFHEVNGTLPPEARAAIKTAAKENGWALAA